MWIGTNYVYKSTLYSQNRLSSTRYYFDIFPLENPVCEKCLPLLMSEPEKVEHSFPNFIYAYIGQFHSK